MQDNNSNALTEYLKSITIPEQIKSNSVLSNFNITIKPSNQNANHQTLIISQDAQRKIKGLFKQGGASQEMLELFGLALTKQKNQFAKLFFHAPKTADILSWAIIRSFKQLQEKDMNVSESVYNSLIQGVLCHEKILGGNSTFKLFLILVIGKVQQVLRKSLKQAIEYFPTLVQYISLLEVYVKNQKQQFKTIRQVFRIAIYMLCWFQAKIIPKRLLDSMQNKNIQKVERDQPIHRVQRTLLNKFYEIVIRYGLVDPEYQQTLLKYILEIFTNSLQNQSTVQLYKMCIILMNKRIFEQYEEKVLSNLQQILDYFIKTTNREIFVKIVKLLITDKDQNFFIQNKKYLLKFAINKQIQTQLFPMYYGLLNNPKFLKHCDNDIVNKLIQWNIKYSVVPQKQFIDSFLKISSIKINSSNQKLIYNSSSTVWNPFIQKIADQKIKLLLQSRKSLSLSSSISLNSPTPIQAQDFTQSTHTYIIYSRKLLQLLMGIQYRKYKQSIQISQTNPNAYPITYICLNQSIQNVRTIRQYSNTILGRAIKNCIYNAKFLEIFLTLSSINEIMKVNQLDNAVYTGYYIACVRSFSDQELLALMPFMMNAFKICKNAFILHIMLCTLLLTYTKPPNQRNQKLQNKIIKYLQEITRIIQSEGFAKITSHHSENVKLVLLLCYLSTEECRNVCKEFLISWAPLMTKADIETLLYQFDTKIFSIDTTSKQENVFNPQGQVGRFIFSTLKSLTWLLNSQSCSSSLYITHTNNCIYFTPIRHSKNQKNSLYLQFKVLINPRLCCNSTIQFYASPRVQPLNMMQKNRIIFKNKKIIFYNRNTRQIQACFDEVKDQLYQRPFAIGIRIANSKFVMEVNKVQLISTDYNYMVDSIRFDLYGDILLKQLKWQRFQQEQRTLQYNTSYQIYPSEVQIKISKLSHYTIKNFQDKLSLLYLCSYLQEIIKVNYSRIDLNQFYQYCCRIVLAKDTAVKNEYSVNEFLAMKKLFRTIIILSENTIKLQIPEILNQKEEENKRTNILKSKKFYQFLICSVVNQKFLTQTTNQGKQKLLKYLWNLLFNQNIGFGFHIQNRKTTIFATIVKFITKIDGEIRDKYSQLLVNILLSHQVNELLLKKISILFSSAYSSKSEYLQRLLDNFFQKIVSVLSILPTQENYHVKAIGKFILSQYKNLQYIFLMTSTDIKLKILDNMIDDQQLSPKCHVVFKDLPEEELLQLSDRIIVYSKKAIFDYFDAKRQNSLNLSNMLFFLQQLTKSFPIVTEQSHKQDTITILSNFMKKSTKLLNHQSQSKKINELVVQKIQSFYTYPFFIRLIGKKIQIYNAEEIKNQTTLAFIHNYFEVLFSSMPKLIVLKALSQFQKSTENAIQTCLYMLNLDTIVMLPEKVLSAFLQYLIEMLIWVKSQGQQIMMKRLASKINDYIQKITKNYAKVSRISRPLLYSYPRLEKVVEINNINSVRKQIIQAKQAQLYELKGGIFFKLLCITFHLFQIFPLEDLSFYISYFLEKIYLDKNKNNNEAVYRATNDFIQVNKQVKNRSPIDLMMRQVQKEHIKYFSQQDEQIIIVNSSPVRTQSGKSVDLDLDLTPYFVDYFFTKLFIYLQNRCTKSASQEQIKILQKYSKQSLSYLKSFEHIWDQMNEKNSQASINYQRIEDLYTLIDEQQDQLTNDRLNSPQVTYRRLTSNSSNRTFGFQQASLNFQTQSNFLGTPKKSIIRKKSALNFDLTSGKKKRKQILSGIEANIYVWSEDAKKKKFHRFFRDQSKQILFYQLLHQLYVRISVNSQKHVQIPKAKRIMGFIKDQQDKHYEEQQTTGAQKISKNKIQIRKVYKFTSQQNPKLKLKRNQFPNLTFPFVKYIQNEKIPTNSSQITQINPELLSTLLYKINEDHMSEPEINLDTIVCLENQQDFEQKQNICEISCPKGVYFCQWELTNKGVIFTSKADKEVKGSYNQRIVKYGSPICNILKIQGKKFQIKIKQVYQIFYRKYNQVRDNSLQFFFKNGFSIYAVFYTKQRTKKFIQKIKKKFSNQFRFIRIVQNFMKSFQSQGYTQKWVSGQMNNFDYLMLVNKYAGRTFCDLNQYYVFPWILEDYTSKILDLSNHKIYRDLKKPIGALRDQKLEKYLQKISKSGEPNDHYLYGSHYSTSLFIYHYLVRLEPYTSLHKDMQSGQFDAPDRLFSSMDQMWQCLMSQSSTSDIKESIPQFYYFPTFLKNINSLNLGKKQSGLPVNHVQLPPWASSPADFILKMRACLQSDYVSSNLNYWIDLIFGKDQKSLQKYNVFHPLSYVENIIPERIQLNNLDAIMSQITFFGQNPYVLFNKQHPKKKIKQSSMATSNLSLYTSLDLSSKQTINSSISKVYEQENLEYIFYISQMFFKTKNIIKLKIAGISKGSSTKQIQLNMDHSIHSMIRTIQKGEQPLTKRLLSQNNIQIPQENINVNWQVQQQEVRFSIGIREQFQIVNNIKLQYAFQNIKFNQTIFVVYGSAGLRVYDWNQDLVWDFSNQFGQVSQCFLEPGLIFFTTSTGRLYVYDFFGSYEDLIFQYAKQTYNVGMLVYPQNKYITKKNEYTYKILLVGDKRKIILLHYTHRVGKLSFKN